MAVETIYSSPASAYDIWLRYSYVRDNGHLDYVKKAKRCEDYFAGLQWDPADLALLNATRRPAMTINKIISTVSTVMGEQIFNRTDVAFKPRNDGAMQSTADILSKVYLQISDRNHLPWVRSDVFSDGIIGSRGFYDMRMDFSQSLRGEIQIEQLNPKNVLVDPDAEEYDPDKWGDVFISKWMSSDMIGLLYSDDAAEELKGRSDSYWPYGYDSIDKDRDRFGAPRAMTYGLGPINYQGMVRNIRVLERQYKQLSQRKYFICMKDGELELVPEAWDRNRIAKYLEAQPDYAVIKKQAERIKWTVVADNIILHDEWSPYKHFTPVPFFPHFRRGRTVGLVENLIGPQDILNKVRSQELHVVNTTANSGWKIKKGGLTNMSAGELENRGSMSGLVLELDDMDSAEKIQPNNTPQGLDRISYKAEEDIKSISGVPDSMQGGDREDVAAKAIQQKAAKGRANLANVMDSLVRTDHILARNMLDLVQEFYTEERVMHITTDRLQNTTTQYTVNQVDPATGAIQNDLSLGEYEVVITTQPERDTFEDSQFDQVMAMFEGGIPIPPAVIVSASRLKDKAEIVKQMEGDQNSPEAQQQKQLALAGQQAEVGKTQAETKVKEADATLKMHKAGKEAVQAHKEALSPPENPNGGEDPAEVRRQFDMEMAMKKDEFAQEMQMKREEFQMEMQLKREEAQAKAATEAKLAEEKTLIAHQAAQKAAQTEPKASKAV